VYHCTGCNAHVVSLTTFHTVINAVAITISELIFFLRMYAMWNRSRLIFIIICCTLAASLGTLMFIFFRFLSSVTFGVPPLPIVSGCYMTGASTVLFASFVDIICAEAVTTSLMLYGAYRHFRHARNLLVQNLMHDGVFYCLSMFVMSVLNVLVIFLLPLQYSQVLVMYQGVMHTILATRMQLHLRKLDCSIHRIDAFSDGSDLPMQPFKRVAPLYDLESDRDRSSRRGLSVLAPAYRSLAFR